MSRQDLVVLVMLVAIPALPATPCVEVCKDQETFSHLVESCRCGGRIVNTAGQSRNPVQPGYHRPQRPQQPVRVSYPASSYRWVVDQRSNRGSNFTFPATLRPTTLLPSSIGLKLLPTATPLHTPRPRSPRRLSTASVSTCSANVATTAGSSGCSVYLDFNILLTLSLNTIFH